MVVTVRGALDGRNREKLQDCVFEIQGAQPVILDLWDVPRCSAAGIGAVRDVKELLERQAWAFAVVADPSGPWPEALGSGPDPIATYTDRRAARSALHYAAL